MSLQTQSFIRKEEVPWTVQFWMQPCHRESGQYLPFSLLYVVKENEKRDLRQEERERNYQAIISQLTEKLNILDEVENGIADIKSFLSAKLTDTPEKPEKDSRT